MEYFLAILQCKGKHKFVAVRAQYAEIDVILQVPIELNFERHTEGKNMSPNPAHPTMFGDESAANLLADMMAKNSSVAPQLQQIADRLGLSTTT